VTDSVGETVDPADNPESLDKDRPLREDIRLLGRLLGDTLREQEGAGVFNLVESVRQTAVRFRRDGGSGIYLFFPA
jgi:phosphoenolpyruvate carboxylase